MPSVSFEVGTRDESAQQTQQPPTLGRDIFFTDDFQVDAGGDYATVEGQENLRAAVLRRLLTAPGEYKLRPDFGVGVRLYLKKPASTANLDALKRRIRDQLSLDRRIDKLTSVDVAATDMNGVRVFIITIVIVSAGQTQRFRPFQVSESGAS